MVVLMYVRMHVQSEDLIVYCASIVLFASMSYARKLPLAVTNL